MRLSVRRRAAHLRKRANGTTGCAVCENSLPHVTTDPQRRTHARQEASSQDTPYGRYITSDGWFVLNLADALAVRNDEKGGAVYPLESREAPFGDFGVHVRVL